MFNFKFDRPFYKEKEFLKIINISRSTCFKWQSEWIQKGGDPRDMGKVLINGSTTCYWNGPKYLDWMIKYKVNHKVKYDYEEVDKQKALLLVSNLKKKKNNG